MPVTHREPKAPEKGSALYRHFGDTRAGFWAAHALLLQVMHPDVSAGVKQHSNFANEAWVRLYETVMSLGAWVYGGQEGAAMEAARLRNMHTQITGTRPDGKRYTALAPAPWAWVFATLIKGSLDAQQYFGRKIPQERLDEIWSQARELGAMMGIRAQDFPDTWAGFEEYFAQVQATELKRTESADDVLEFLRNVAPPAPLRWIPSLIWKALMFVPSRLALTATAGTLPPALRDELGLKWSRGRAVVLTVFRAVVRAVCFLLPQRVMVLPSVLVGKASTARLREQARREGEMDAMRAHGQWEERWAWGWGAQLEVKQVAPLEHDSQLASPLRLSETSWLAMPELTVSDSVLEELRPIREAGAAPRDHVRVTPAPRLDRSIREMAAALQEPPRQPAPAATPPAPPQASQQPPPPPVPQPPTPPTPPPPLRQAPPPPARDDGPTSPPPKASEPALTSWFAPQPPVPTEPPEPPPAPPASRGTAEAPSQRLPEVPTVPPEPPPLAEEPAPVPEEPTVPEVPEVPEAPEVPEVSRAQAETEPVPKAAEPAHESALAHPVQTAGGLLRFGWQLGTEVGGGLIGGVREAISQTSHRDEEEQPGEPDEQS